MCFSTLTVVVFQLCFLFVVSLFYQLFPTSQAMITTGGPLKDARGPQYLDRSHWRYAEFDYLKQIV